jgi:4'-phosphopantetheinyl transferase
VPDVSYVLEGGIAHVWRIPVAVGAAAAGDLSGVLSDAELARAGRFTRDADRQRFLLGRAATRCILGKYLDLPPRKLGIDADPAGKPRLSAATVAPDRNIQFNLSHSGGWVVAAFARSFPVGIDVETVTLQGATEDLIDYFMGDGERRALRRCRRSSARPPSSSAGLRRRHLSKVSAWDCRYRSRP